MAIPNGRFAQLYFQKGMVIFMKAHGHAIKYGSNVDTDVIIPARYLNSSDHAHLAAHAMEDLDPTFAERVQPGDIVEFRFNV